MFRTLSRMFMSNTSTTTLLDVASADPFPPEFFLRRVLVPKVTSLLIAEDLELPSGHPKVKCTLEASRPFGSVVHPDDDEAEKFEETSSLALSHQLEPRILKQLPRFMVFHIGSTFDPPALGNCGYLAIADAVGIYSKTSYIEV